MENNHSNWVFFSMFMLCIVLNMDQGLFPAASDMIKKELNFDNADFGLLGSVVYFGLVLGSVISGIVFSQFNSKIVLISCQFGFLCTIFAISLTNTRHLIFLARFLSGIFQVFISVFVPVWIDLRASQKKDKFLTIYQLGTPLGVFLGYSTTAVITNFLDWKWVIYIQMIFATPFILHLMLQPSSSLNIISEEKAQIASEISSVSLTSINSQKRRQTDVSYQLSTGYFFTLDSKAYRRTSINIEYQFSANRNVYIDQISQVSRRLSSEQNISLQIQQQSPVLKVLSMLFFNMRFVTSVLTCSVLFFVVTGIQYWISDYINLHLKVPLYQVQLVFSLTSISAPTLGVIMGGYLTQKIGGYTNSKVHKMCLILGIFSLMVSLPMPFCEEPTIVFVGIWLLLFFGGSMLPAQTGIMISSVDEQYRPFSSAAGQFFQNILGFMPASYIIGVVMNTYGPFYAMLLLFYWTINAFILLSISFLWDYYKRNSNKDLKQKLQKKEIQISS